MFIDALDVYSLSMPLVQPFVTSLGTQSLRRCLILRLTGGGVEGWGECVAGDGPWYTYETVETAWHVITSFIVPQVVGHEITDAADLWARLACIRGHRMAIAAVEQSLWDLLARAAGQPLARVLGGTRAETPSGVSLGLRQSPDALAEAVAACVNEGYRRVKVKIAPGRDLTYVAAVRERFPDLMLSVDANSAYTLADADHLAELDAYDLLMIEQPLGDDDIVDHAALQRRLRTAICLDESICSPEDARQAIALGSCRMINIKPGRVGGLWRSRQIHDLCQAAGMPVWCGGMLETNIGRAANVCLASLANFSLPSDISASARYFKADIAGPPFELSASGTMVVRSTPGIGVDVDGAALARVTTGHQRFAADEA
jgi:O-succinylbenzoate synthase